MIDKARALGLHSGRDVYLSIPLRIPFDNHVALKSCLVKGAVLHWRDTLAFPPDKPHSISLPPVADNR